VVFYYNLEDVILPVMQTDQVCDAVKQELVPKQMPDMQEQAQGTRDIIHRYITPSEEEFGSPFDLWESRQQPGQ
jgi:hypothetical protein